MSETFEQAIERCLMDGTTAKALRLIAADFDDESNGFIEIAALQQGADGLDTLVARVADLTASRDRASDACATVQRERDEAREEVDRLRSVLKSHPGWRADVTFAAIWKWLALKDEALGEDHETARYEASK